jgi:uncharacterized protein
MLQVSELFIYPIKSLGGISPSSALVTDRGFRYDRRWMLVDSDNQFMTQRDFAEMTLLQVQVEEDGLKVTHKQKGDSIAIPFETNDETISVQVWSDRVKGIVVDKKLDEWFSNMLSTSCRLVYMPDQTQRRVDGRYASNKEITSFSDGYPFLIIGQSSLDDLNNRIEEKLPINRFRPNIVFTSGEPYEEDSLAHFAINDIHFYGVKLCSRCVITTINQDTVKKGNEPLRTLSKYRMKNNKIYFGQNLLHHGEGSIHIGDELEVLERKPSRF